MRAPRLRRDRAAAAASLPNAAGLRTQAEEAAARLPSLLVAADRVASTVAQGIHGRRRVGRGDAFWQFRRYEQGDSIQAIDWRQTAKSRHAFVRETEWEAAQTVWLWNDTSGSMAYRSSEELPEKRDRALVLTLALTSLLIRAGEQVATLGSGMRPSNSRAAISRIGEDIWSRRDAPASLPPVEDLARYSRLVLIGDFLSPSDEVVDIIRRFAGRGVQGHIVQILDPAEETLPFRGRVLFEGLEGESSALIGRVEMVRNDYTALMHAHRDSIADAARSAGWGFLTHHTDQPPHSALMTLHTALSEKTG